MGGLSRREFLASVSALAAAWGLPQEQVGALLAQPALATATTEGTTLERTIRFATAAERQYRKLLSAPGEEYVVRLDVLGREAAAARTTARRSLYYLGHFSDIHLMDAQSPARLEPMIAQNRSLWAGAFRPQDTLTVHVLAAMVEAMAAAKASPVTGAPMSAAFVTGDSADMLSELETRWYIDMLDGTTVTPNSGQPGVYDGVQAWDDTPWAYHPEDPTGDPYGEYGFPALPGLLTAAVSNPVVSPGLPVPWYATYGNHDTTFLGTLGVDAAMRAWAVGDTKFSAYEPLIEGFLSGLSSNASAFQRFYDALVKSVGLRPGSHTVPADPARKLLEQTSFMQAHLQSPAVPGPVGHGFTQENVDTGRTWWRADVGSRMRLFGLDTCNQVSGPDGAVPQEQFDWLKAELERCQQEQVLAVVLSHHNSLTLENEAVPVFGSSQRLVHAEEFIAMLQEYPACIAWMNGHTHINTIQAHPRGDGKGGFWEITTASCIDFPQQQQTMEVVDNRDGTMSLFTTVLDHASPALTVDGAYTQTALASWSRELAANDWVENPTMRLGSPLDRNCELLLPAPFDLSVITDADLEREQAALRTRLLAYESKAGGS